MNRRKFNTSLTAGLSSLALSRLLSQEGQTSDLTHFPAKAKRVIYLFQSGAPSQMDLFDYKPKLQDLAGTDLPESIRKGQRLTGMTATQERFPLAPSVFDFARHGNCGAWVSDLLPHTAKIVDELCFIRSLHTEAINHDPAITFFQTGFQLAGRPSIGSWLSYGLGNDNENLPGFVALTSGNGGQPLYDRLWGSGFLPSRYQGVRFRSKGDPVLYLSDPGGVDQSTRRRMLDDVSQLNALRFQQFQDPEIQTRIAQYEMAFRMQTSVPELTDLSSEPEHTFELYGEDARQPGTYAHNCLLARRLTERGVRFVQLFERGWDHHTELPKNIRERALSTDRASAALVVDLKQRGLLDDTLVLWGGEFGRTAYCQGRLTDSDYGRDHHPRCFTMWLAGGGVRPGITYGKTDDFSYNILENPVHVHDLHATILHQLGVDHTKLTYKFQGRHYRLTDVHGKVVQEILGT